MTSPTPEQMRWLADRLDGLEHSLLGGDGAHIVVARDVLRATADELKASQVPIFLTVNELDSLPEGTVVVGRNGLIWQRDLVGYPANGRLAWFPLEQEVGSGSDAVGNGARVILAAQQGDSFE